MFATTYRVSERQTCFVRDKHRRNGGMLISAAQRRWLLQLINAVCAHARVVAFHWRSPASCQFKSEPKNATIQLALMSG